MGLLLLDFDGTITQQDTLHALVTLAIAANSASSSSSSSPPSGATRHNSATPPDPPTSIISTADIITPPPPKNGEEPTATDQPQVQTQKKEELTSLWSKIVRDYVAAHAKHREGYHTPAERRTTLDQELAFLESVEAVERESVTRVGGAGFFRGLGGPGVMEGLGRDAVAPGGGDDLGRGGESNEDGAGQGGKGGSGAGKGAVNLRRGLGEFLERQAAVGWDLAVVSVNWSGEFIKGVVEGGCGKGQGGKVKKVVANGIGFPDGRVRGPSELGGEPLVTAGDKLRAMKSLRKGLEEEKVVYFGDSTTDLACLMEADFGVVMADDGESKLLKTLERVGIEVSHVGEAGAESKLVWARDFEEVLQSGVMGRI